MRKEELQPIDTYKFEGGTLYRESISGWHDDSMKCTRNVGKFKIYATRFDAALPYTVYYVADTETGEVFRGEAQHYWSGNNHLGELVDSLKAVE